MLYKIYGKFSASGIIENRPCLAGYKYIDVLHNWLYIST